jgi:hypothetical protein
VPLSFLKTHPALIGAYREHRSMASERSTRCLES